MDGHTPYIAQAHSNVYGDYYTYFCTGRGSDFLSETAGFLPGFNIAFGGAKWMLGYSEIDSDNLGTEAKNLMNTLKGIRDNSIVKGAKGVASALGIFKNAGKLSDVLKAGSKFMGKAASIAGTIFNGVDLAHFFSDDEYISQQLVSKEFGFWLRSTTEDGLKQKYIYTILRVKQLIGQGKLTYKQDWKGNITHYNLDYGIFKQVQNELRAIDTSRVKTRILWIIYTINREKVQND